MSAYQQVQDTALQQIEQVQANASQREQFLREKAEKQQLERENTGSSGTGEFDAGTPPALVRDFSDVGSSKNVAAATAVDTDVPSSHEPSTDPSRDLSNDVISSSDIDSARTKSIAPPPAPSPAISRPEFENDIEVTSNNSNVTAKIPSTTHSPFNELSESVDEQLQANADQRDAREGGDRQSANANATTSSSPVPPLSAQEVEHVISSDDVVPTASVKSESAAKVSTKQVSEKVQRDSSDDNDVGIWKRRAQEFEGQIRRLAESQAMQATQFDLQLSELQDRVRRLNADRKDKIEIMKEMQQKLVNEKQARRELQREHEEELNHTTSEMEVEQNILVKFRIKIKILYEKLNLKIVFPTKKPSA